MGSNKSKPTKKQVLKEIFGSPEEETVSNDNAQVNPEPIKPPIKPQGLKSLFMEIVIEPIKDKVKWNIERRKEKKQRIKLLKEEWKNRNSDIRELYSKLEDVYEETRKGYQPVGSYWLQGYQPHFALVGSYAIEKGYDCLKKEFDNIFGLDTIEVLAKKYGNDNGGGLCIFFVKGGKSDPGQKQESYVILKSETSGFNIIEAIYTSSYKSKYPGYYTEYGPYRDKKYVCGETVEHNSTLTVGKIIQEGLTKEEIIDSYKEVQTAKLEKNKERAKKIAIQRKERKERQLSTRIWRAVFTKHQGPNI